MCYSKFTMDEL